MQARKVSESAATPIQLSLRIRHPEIDPEEISSSLGLTPEHCFKAGDSRSTRSGSRVTGHHSQTYWLAPVTVELWPDPIEPTFLAAIAARNPDRSVAETAQDLEAATSKTRSQSVEGLLMYFLLRLNAKQSFLQKVQAGGGDVSLIMVIDRESAGDFALPVALARLLVQLGISIEFNFDS
jgi:hypothetical protein